MMFVFAYIAQSMGVVPQRVAATTDLLTEAAFVIVTFVCVLLAERLRGTGPQPLRDAVAFVGGVSASFSLIMPFELAPMFFGVHGEWMMATMVLILLYPIAAFFSPWRSVNS